MWANNNNKKKLASTWTPATPLKTPDHIISSDYTKAKIFVPSYEKNCDQCIEQLLTNEYQRIWWKEQEAWSKVFYANKNQSKRILCRGRNQKQMSKSTTEKCAPKCKKSQNDESNSKKCWK
ncbi:uncharacterized protein LOC122499830 [Leptopilina heterotoma]|uniref:uncharacterized protein LOC122499830 n=1 Tax=Leptopilina heterotoma TaxID=63436 RepID=UPI001CA80616|nr:uncharacterized protein LOC122499830 [Leptopilina heterotoma]